MSTTTITRTTITDDDGTGTTGTVFNASFFSVSIWGAVDSLIAGDIQFGGHVLAGGSAGHIGFADGYFQRTGANTMKYWNGTTIGTITASISGTIVGSLSGHNSTELDDTASIVYYTGTQVVTHGAGAVGAPSVTFSGATTTGLYSSGGLAITKAGTQQAVFSGSGLLDMIGSAAGFRLGSANDVVMTRLAAGQLSLQKDSTHGVVLDVATDAYLALYQRDGATWATLRSNGSYFGQNTTIGGQLGLASGGNIIMSSRWQLTGSVDGVMQLTDSGASNGVGLNVTTDGTLWVKTRANADTAILKANTFTSTGSVSDSVGSMATLRAAIASIPFASVLKSGGGTSTTTSANNLDSVAISGLTALDQLWVIVWLEQTVQDSSGVDVYNSTDSVSLDTTAALTAPAYKSRFSPIMRSRSSNTKLFWRVAANFQGAANTPVTVTTGWTGSWTLALRSLGMTSGGQLDWSWAVLMAKGQ